MQIFVLDTPTALPAQCWSCGSASKKYYVDIGLQIEFYGAFYLCNECFHDVATKVGYDYSDSRPVHPSTHRSEQSNVAEVVEFPESSPSGTAIKLELGEGETPESRYDKRMAIIRSDESEPSVEFSLNL